jgi:N-acetylmuramoyl-L-alanine amidase
LEKTLNLDVSKRVVELLEADGRVKVYSTRLTDIDPSFPARVALANEYGDLFVSIHHNAFNGIANGTEVLWSSRVNTNPRSITSFIAASIMQEHLVEAINLLDRGPRRDNGLIVLNDTRIPAILVEVAFMDNAANAELLKSDDFLQLAAIGIFNGIMAIFSEYTPER